MDEFGVDDEKFSGWHPRTPCLTPLTFVLKIQFVGIDSAGLCVVRDGFYNLFLLSNYSKKENKYNSLFSCLLMMVWMVLMIFVVMAILDGPTCVTVI